jgi:Bacterial Ig domain
VVGVQFFLDGATLGAEVTAPPFTVSWDTTTGTLGSHTLTARARDGAGRQTTSAAVTVTVVAPPPPTLAIDATAFGDRGTPATTVATTAFSTTSANQLLVAFIAADDATATPKNTVTGVSGGGLTWTMVVRTNVQRGTAEVWRAVAVTALTNVAVTATLAQQSASSITVVSFNGADTSGTNGSNGIGATLSASGANGAPTGNVTTTRANSSVWGVGVDWDSAIGRTIGTGQTMVHQFLAPVGDTYWVQRRTAATPTIGSVVTINDTAPTTDQWNLSIVEIRPKP